ncbi:protein kinase [Candidatus Latescibacterota bacterium]
MVCPKGGNDTPINKRNTAIPGKVRILPQTVMSKHAESQQKTLFSEDDDVLRISQLKPPDEEHALRINLSGQYKIIRKLGEGGMASVYLAHEKDLDREVAIKVLPRTFLHDKKFIERFKREARIAAKLEHPNIINIYQINIEEDLCYIVMSYVKGLNLSEEIASKGALPVENIVLWGSEICSALSYAHKNDVIHRDLKPENIMIDQNGRVVVMDFGIAYAVHDIVLTQTGTVMGSPLYMSPEMAKGEKIDTRSDIYSIGVILYQMATATLPFQASGAPSLMYMHVHEPPDPPDVRNSDVPPWLRDIILKCLTKNPDDRFSSSSKLQIALEGHKAPKLSPAILKDAKKYRKEHAPGQIIDVLEKIPIFRGLSFEQFKKILMICSRQKILEGEILCHAGEESLEIFILIRGKLQVTFEDGKEFSRIRPLGIVGEMGVFTGDTRSATVVTASKCTILTIKKDDLFRVFDSDPVLGILVQSNVIDDLTRKMKTNNIIIEELKQLCPPNEFSAIISRVFMDNDE